MGLSSHCFRDKRRFESKITNFPTRRVFCAPSEGIPLEILELCIRVRGQKTRMMGLPDGPKVLRYFSRLDTIPACDRQQDRHLSTAKTALAEGRAGKNEYYIATMPPHSQIS